MGMTQEEWQCLEWLWKTGVELRKRILKLEKAWSQANERCRKAEAERDEARAREKHWHENAVRMAEQVGQMLAQKGKAELECDEVREALAQLTKEEQWADACMAWNEELDRVVAERDEAMRKKDSLLEALKKRTIQRDEARAWARKLWQQCKAADGLVHWDSYDEYSEARRKYLEMYDEAL